MKKAKKSVLFILLFVLLFVLSVCLCACSDGANGKNGSDGKDGTDGADGADGKSAYEVWLDNGHTGTESEFLDWLKGGDGKSAYEIWLDNGHTGTESEFLDWLKGDNGTVGEQGLSAYKTFLKYYPDYAGTEEQWIRAVVEGELKIHTVTFKSGNGKDTVKYVLDGCALKDVPEVPVKAGQTGGRWSVRDFTNITYDMNVVALYDNSRCVTFRNEYTDDADIVIAVDSGEAITSVPRITAKAGNSAKWSVTDLGCITQDMTVYAVYETTDLKFAPINMQTQYCVTRSYVDPDTEELFIPAEHNGKPVTVIDENAFASEIDEGVFRENKIKTAHIPEGITDILSGAFSGCGSLKSVIIPDSVTNIGSRAFYNCGSLTSVKIPDGVSEISSQILGGCGNLTTVTLPEGITDIGYEAFCNCRRLTSITIPSTVTRIWSEAFFGCDSIKTITIPAGVTDIFDNAFKACGDLESITVESGNTVYKSVDNCLIDTEEFTLLSGCKNSVIPYDGSVTNIGPEAFYNCTGLTSIEIPHCVTRISAGAFSGCISLTSVMLGNGVAEIYHEAFYDCRRLKSIRLTNTVKNIKEGAFSGCDSLETVYYDDEENWNKIGIDLYNRDLTNATRYYYSYDRPTAEGNYWHYDTDGVTPVVWDQTANS